MAFSLIEVQPEWVLETESLGSKRKYWFRPDFDQQRWLFKFSRPNTGEHWAEKLAEQVAQNLSIRHATFEFARLNGNVGIASRSFVDEGWTLYHGNQVLAGYVVGYDPTLKFRSRTTL